MTTTQTIPNKKTRKTIEVSSKSWPEFCQQFSKLVKGATVNVDVLDFDGRITTVARALPIQELVLETADACSDDIYVLLGDPHEITHTIVEPIHIRIQDEDERTKILTIDAESGTTRIHFPLTDMAEMLEGLKLI